MTNLVLHTRQKPKEPRGPCITSKVKTKRGKSWFVLKSTNQKDKQKQFSTRID